MYLTASTGTCVTKSRICAEFWWQVRRSLIQQTPVYLADHVDSASVFKCCHVQLRPQLSIACSWVFFGESSLEHSFGLIQSCLLELLRMCARWLNSSQGGVEQRTGKASFSHHKVSSSYHCSLLAVYPSSFAEGDTSGAVFSEPATSLFFSLQSQTFVANGSQQECSSWWYHCPIRTHKFQRSAAAPACE